jgi:hypothetical protein
VHANSRRPAPKAAALAELDSLRRHLYKGRLLTSWEARYVPEKILSEIAENMAKGLSVDGATAVAKIAVERAEIMEKHVTSPLARQVAKQLAADYPSRSLGWVLHDAEWHGPVEVSLENVDFSNRKKWNAWHETTRVGEMEKRLRKRIRKGDHLKPAVLIDRPGSPPSEDMMVVDGHHRSLASLKAGEPVWAYIGKVREKVGPWDEFHASQCKHGDEDAADGK